MVTATARGGGRTPDTSAPSLRVPRCQRRRGGASTSEPRRPSDRILPIPVALRGCTGPDRARSPTHAAASARPLLATDCIPDRPTARLRPRDRDSLRSTTDQTGRRPRPERNYRRRAPRRIRRRTRLPGSRGHRTDRLRTPGPNSLVTPQATNAVRRPAENAPGQTDVRQRAHRVRVRDRPEGVVSAVQQETPRLSTARTGRLLVDVDHGPPRSADVHRPLAERAQVIVSGGHGPSYPRHRPSGRGATDGPRQRFRRLRRWPLQSTTHGRNQRAGELRVPLRSRAPSGRARHSPRLRWSRTVCTLVPDSANDSGGSAEN